MKLSGRQREALSNLASVPEGLLIGAGMHATFVFDCLHVLYLSEAEKFAKRKLCEIETLGESTFVRITEKGRAAISSGEGGEK